MNEEARTTAPGHVYEPNEIINLHDAMRFTGAVRKRNDARARPSTQEKHNATVLQNEK